MISLDKIFTEVFFKTRSFPDFQNVVLYIDNSTYIENLFEICGINSCFAPLPIGASFYPDFIPDCLVFDHKTHSRFIQEKIKKYHPRKIIIVSTHPSKNNLQRFESVLQAFGYGQDVKFAREAAQIIPPRIRSCLFVLEEGTELVPNKFYSPRDIQPFMQNNIEVASPQDTIANESIVAAELRAIKTSYAYKASLALSKFVKSNKLVFRMATAVLSFRRRYKNRGNQ